ncbi:MAG: hypothetical protein AABZ63_06225, partial [Actinomycetota bacterium]
MKKVLGVVLRAAAVLLWVFGAFGVGSLSMTLKRLKETGPDSDTFSLVAGGALFIVGVIALILGTALNRLGRSLMQATAEEALRTDLRPPVLLLRSFQMDQTEIERPANLRDPVTRLQGLAASGGGLIGYGIAKLVLHFSRVKYTFEEALVEVLREIG